MGLKVCPNEATRDSLSTLTIFRAISVSRTGETHRRKSLSKPTL